jgi:multisubunit Na+/H+ antiporter MnhE subunit
VRHLVRALLVVPALAVLWLLYVGEYTHVELWGAIAAAVVVLGWVELVRRQGVTAFGFEREWAIRAVKTPLKLVPDFVRVLAALPRARAGSYRAIDFPAGGDDPTSAGRRALATYAGSFTPATVVVDVDMERRTMLIHDFPPKAGPEPPL